MKRLLCVRNGPKDHTKYHYYIPISQNVYRQNMFSSFTKDSTGLPISIPRWHLELPNLKSRYFKPETHQYQLVLLKFILGNKCNTLFVYCMWTFWLVLLCLYLLSHIFSPHNPAHSAKHFLLVIRYFGAYFKQFN